MAAARCCLSLRFMIESITTHYYMHDLGSKGGLAMCCLAPIIH